jgi:rhamnose utilization protein RhaD (predicted bifunctional aldolase and dehydrogenase)
MSTLRASVTEYCSVIGKDPLLVQGAGGNVSWKEGDTLWVKASGTWLADAAEKDIFVPVDLLHLRAAIEDGDFSVSPKVIGGSLLRPSIETLLHALVPNRVVVHLHAIEILAHLVRTNFKDNFKFLLNNFTSWAVVDYYKPGAALAESISDALVKKPDINIIFLKNHGIVIGGGDVTEVNQMIRRLTTALSTRPSDIYPTLHLMPMVPENLIGQYLPVADFDLHQLALDYNIFNRLIPDWALYPDHIVFLGSRAYVYRTWEDFNEQRIFLNELPDLIFINGEGVYIKPSFNKAKIVQLRCYFDVIVRQKAQTPVCALTNAQIDELLDWDAEQYRRSLANA